MKLTMLGTGMAMVTACYNTCFILEEEGESFLIDGGGGNGILVQLEKAGIDWKSIHHILLRTSTLTILWASCGSSARLGRG